MATVVRTYEPKFWDRFYLPGIIQGLLITLGRMFGHKDTVQYPEVRHVPPEGYRGLHRLNKHADGRIKCVACEMCATACPSHCISIEPSEAPWDEGEERFPVKFEIDLLRCIYCGFCESACPKDAIELTEIFDFGGYAKDKFTIDKDGLLRVYDITSGGNIYEKINRGETVADPLTP